MRYLLPWLLICLPVRAQLFPIGPLLAASSQPSGGATEIQYPLDLVTNTFFGAYSFSRKLRSAYAGSALVVTRANDSATNNIGFLASGLVDNDAVLTFCGTNRGTATVAYDQTGNNRNLLNSGGPMLCDNGVLITNNTGRLAAKWDGTDDLLQSAALSTTLPLTYFLVARLDAFTLNDLMVSVNSTTQGAIKSGSTGGIRLNSGAILAWTGAALTATNFYLIDTWLESGTSDFINVNAATATVGTAGDNTSGGALVWGSSTLCPAMTCTEWLVVTGPISAGERTMISTNTMTFYGIP